jgi:hypothetical protein
MKKTAIGIASLLMAASMAFALDIVQFKAGDISVSVLDTDATTPMQTASVKALDASSGAVAAEAVSDELGQAVLSLDAGRYVMNVNDLNLAVFDVSAVDGLSLCRIIMPDAALLVGGQEAKDSKKGGGTSSSGAAASESGAAVAGGLAGMVEGASWVVPAGIVAGAAILVGATWAVVEHQQPSKTIGRHDVTPPSTPEQPQRHHDVTPTPRPTPTPVPPEPVPPPNPSAV